MIIKLCFVDERSARSLPHSLGLIQLQHHAFLMQFLTMMLDWSHPPHYSLRTLQVALYLLNAAHHLCCYFQHACEVLILAAVIGR